MIAQNVLIINLLFPKKKCRIIAEKQMPLACIKFAKEKGKQMVQDGLVPNFMAHLVNLFDLGLITPTNLKESMGLVRSLEEGVS